MSEIVNQSLQKIAKGTGIVFLDTTIGMGLAFLERVLVARYFLYNVESRNYFVKKLHLILW
jgi:uncharacterized membrane protein required for colicin V production